MFLNKFGYPSPLTLFILGILPKLIPSSSEGDSGSNIPIQQRQVSFLYSNTRRTTLQSKYQMYGAKSQLQLLGRIHSIYDVIFPHYHWPSRSKSYHFTIHLPTFIIIPQSNIMAEVQTGGCLCGKLRYELQADAEPIYSVICHCLNCKKSSGTHMVNASIFLKNVRKD